MKKTMMYLMLGGLLIAGGTALAVKSGGGEKTTKTVSMKHKAKPVETMKVGKEIVNKAGKAEGFKQRSKSTSNASSQMLPNQSYPHFSKKTSN